MGYFDEVRITKDSFRSFRVCKQVAYPTWGLVAVMEVFLGGVAGLQGCREDVGGTELVVAFGDS